MNSNIVERDETIKALTRILEELKSNQSSIEDHVKDLEQTVDTLENQLTLVRAENNNYVKIIDEKLNIIKERDEELENLKEKNNKFNEDLKNFSEKKSNHENESERLQEENLKLSIELENSQKKINKLTDELTDTKEINNTFNEDLRKSESITINLRNEFEIRLKSFDEQTNILKSLVSEQKQQLIDAYTDHEKELSEKLIQIELYEKKINKLKNELSQSAQTNDVAENLRTMLDKQEEDLHYKQETIDSLNNQIIDLYRTINECNLKCDQMIIHQDELEEVIDRKTRECEDLKVQLQKHIREKDMLVKEMNEKADEMEKLRSSVSSSSDQSTRITELEKSLADMDSKNKEQLDKLKKFAANLKKKVAQCTELENKLANQESISPESIIDLNELKNEKELLQLKYNEKAQTCLQLEQEISILKSELNKTHDSVQQSAFNKETIEELNFTIKRLQEESKIQTNTISRLENQLIELKSVHDIEINKRENSLNLLEHEIEKLNQMMNDKDSVLESNKRELNSINDKIKEIDLLKDDVKNKNIKIEKCKAVIKEKMKEINRLNTTCEELNQQINILNARQQQHLTANEDKTRIEQLSIKIDENMLYIETIETENTELKDKIEKLENELRNIDEIRCTLESQSSVLEQNYNEKLTQQIQNECELNDRLSVMDKHREILEKQLINFQTEKIELINSLETTKQINDELNKKNSQLHNHITFIESEKLPDIEKEKQTLSTHVESLKADLKRLHADFENRLHDKSCEFDDAELNYEQQIECMRKDNRNLEELLEKVRDECSFLKDEVVQLKDSIHLLEQVKTDIERELTWTKLQNETLTHDQHEIQELRMQVVQDQTEIENLRSQNQIILQNYEIEVNDLKKQLSELDSMNLQVGQNQTDDQVMLQHENNKLRDLLLEKENEIEQYQQRQNNLQLPSTSSAVDGNELLSNSDRELALEASLREKDIEINDLKIEIADLQRNMIRQTSQQEIDAVVAVAEEHVRALQQNINTETVANMRHKYENNIKLQEKQLNTLQIKIDTHEAYIKELEEKYKNLHILREESLNQLANKTKLSDELKNDYTLAQQKIIDLENQIRTQSINSENINTIANNSSQSNLNVVPSFDGSMFFGQATSSVFDDHIIPSTHQQPLQSQKLDHNVSIPFFKF